MSEMKEFPIRVLLTITTGRLLTASRASDDNGIGDLYALLGWMTNDSPFIHQLHRFADECKPWLLRWYPELSHISTGSLDELIEQEGSEVG